MAKAVEILGGVASYGVGVSHKDYLHAFRLAALADVVGGISGGAYVADCVDGLDLVRSALESAFVAGSCDTFAGLVVPDEATGSWRLGLRKRGGCVDQRDLGAGGGVAHVGEVPCDSEGDRGCGSDDTVDAGSVPVPGSKVGVNYEKNKRKRQARQLRRRVESVKVSEACVVDEVGSGSMARAQRGGDEAGELRKSLEAKWKAENALAVERANRELLLLQSSDIDAEKRKRRVRTTMAIERDMVAIEKTHGKLAAAGDVPGVFPGSVETIVSGCGSGTISPSSSVSEAEVRKLQKDNADMVKELEGARRILKRFHLDQASPSDYEKSLYTLDDAGNLPADTYEKLEKMYPEGYIFDPGYGDRALVTPVYD